LVYDMSDDYCVEPEMNERIRELMEEVVRIEIDPDSKMETIYTCGPEDFEAFAELIVRECCNVLYDNELGGYQVNHVLKEHFGVEK
jgi:hypothetical protein